MKPRITFKDVPIGERIYRLTKTDPRTACWLFTSLAAKAPDGSRLMSALGKCTRQEFDEIQGLALKHVFFLDNQNGEIFPIPVITAGGLFGDKEVESDPSLLFKLTTDCVMFNIEPFLVVSGSTDQP